MTAAAPGFQLSIEELPESEGLDYWRAIIGRIAPRLDVVPLRGRWPGPMIASGGAGGPRTQRISELLVNGNDDLLLPIVLAGASLNCQRGHGAALGSGGEALRLLRGYIKLLAEDPSPATPELQRLVVAHVHDLVALVIGGTHDAAGTAKARCSRAARLSAIKADIAARVGEPELTISAVAARQRLSPRYVEMLFKDEGTTFSHFVRDQRLERAHRMLTDPRYAGWSISTIALEAGFSDLSHFNRDFRRLYAASPSDVRAGAQRHDGE